MKPILDKPQRVRGVVVAGSRWAGCVSIDNDECAVARTFWYRHDDDLAELERELNKLVRTYSESSKGSGMAYYYEYKDYEN